MKQNDLDQEYSAKAARKSLHRQAHQRRILNQAKAIEAAPIDQPDQLSDAVAQLAAVWGLKRKQP